MNIRAKRHLGQNFLVDKNIREKIIGSIGLENSDIVFEIGAGRGEMTDLLSRKASFVYALEIDRALCAILKKKFANQNNVMVINGNILKFDFESQFKTAPKKIKIAGNIPYYITTPIIELILNWRKKIHSAFITVQKEFAERIVAVPGSKTYGSLSCFVQYYAQARVLFNISKGSFRPIPKVNSSLLEILIRPNPAVNVNDEDDFFKIIRAGFNKRRKTLRNSLSGIADQEKLKNFFEKYGIDLNIRPEELSLSDFANLERFLKIPS